MAIVSLNGRRYAFGLKWQPFKGLPGVEQRAEAATMLRAQRARQGVIFDNAGRPVLGGLVGDARGRGTIFSAAVALAARDKRTLVVAGLGEGNFWICQAGGSTINPATDIIVPENVAKEEIRKLYTSLMSRGGDVAMYVTRDLTFDGAGLSAAERVSLEEIFAAPPPPNAELEQLGGRSRREIVIVAAASLFVVGALGHWALEWKDKRDAALAALRADQQRMNIQVDVGREREAAIDTAVLRSLQDDTKSPLPSSLIARCVAAADALGDYPGGWLSMSIRCDSVSPTATATLGLRSNDAATLGDPATLHSFARAYGASASVAPSLRDASVNVPLMALDDREPLAATSALPHMLEFQEHEGTALVQRARVLPSFTFAAGEFVIKKITFTEVDPATKQVQQSPVPDDRAYREATITIEAASLGDLPIAQLDAPHARLDRLEIFRTNAGRRFTATYRLFLGV